VSIRVMTAVWDSPRVPPGRLLLLLALADAANDEGVCWPSVPTLARKCRSSDRTIQRHLRDLVGVGLLAIEDRPGTSQRYRIHLAALATGGDNVSPVGVSDCHRGGDTCVTGRGDTALSPEPLLEPSLEVPPTPRLRRGTCPAHTTKPGRSCRRCGTSPRAAAAADKEARRPHLAGSECSEHGTIRNDLGVCSGCRADSLAGTA
jgi:hypothetical protein